MPENHLVRANIPGIKPEHLDRMFDGFRATVEARIGELRAANDANGERGAAFFEYLLNEVDAEQFGRIQQLFLADAGRAENSNMLKYIDPVTWFESKLSIARWLALDRQAPLRILDLGTGPGHFPVVARFYGHTVVGTDLPSRSSGVGKTGHLYDALCDLYCVTRISHTIRPFEPLGDLDGRYDMVTAFLAAFNVDQDKRPWSEAHWRFFLTDLAENVLTNRGVLFMRLTHDKLTDEAWAYLASLAEWKEDQSRQVYITDFSAFS
jgi:hypothetical protein